MATLRFGQQRTLPPPRPPRRSKLPDTDVALRYLGFDANFDLSMQCKADAIHAEEVQMERRLHCALQRLRSHAPRANLPWACVHLRKSLPRSDGQKQEEKKYLPPDQSEDPKLKLSERVAYAAGVAPEDVLVEVSNEEVQCTVQVTRAGASVVGCQQSLALATKDKGGGLERGDPSGIHRAFAEVGAVENLNVSISVSWSAGRAIEEVNLLHPGYTLEDAQLSQIMQAADDARKAFSSTWNDIEKEESEPATNLLGLVPIGRFVGGDDPEVLPLEVGLASGLFLEPHKQDAASLNALMETAAEAHLMLKALLAPNSAWSTEAMNDLVDISYEDDCRRYASNDWDLIPEATLVDPGLKAEKHMFEKAKLIQMPHHIAPPVMDLLDVSRIFLLFKSCEDLCIGVKRLQEKFNVVFLENRFLFPSYMGHRCVILGVRQTMPSGASHISRLVLEHKRLFTVKETVSAACMRQISTCLTKIGMASREIANVKRVILRQLAFTKGDAIHAQEQELIQALAFAQAARTLIPNGTELAQQLVEEALDQALAAGVLETRAKAAMSRFQACDDCIGDAHE